MKWARISQVATPEATDGGLFPAWKIGISNLESLLSNWVADATSEVLFGNRVSNPVANAAMHYTFRLNCTWPRPAN